ncbi:transcriptional regulator [Pycnococcus provasolii]
MLRLTPSRVSSVAPSSSSSAFGSASSARPPPRIKRSLGSTQAHWQQIHVRSGKQHGGGRRYGGKNKHAHHAPAFGRAGLVCCATLGGASGGASASEEDDNNNNKKITEADVSKPPTSSADDLVSTSSVSPDEEEMVSPAVDEVDNSTSWVSDAEDEDEEITLPELGDWREFRARLVEQQKLVGMPAAGDVVRDTTADDVPPPPPLAAAVEELELRERHRQIIATEANRDLMESQTPWLANEPVWAHPIAQAERGCLLVAAADQFCDKQEYFAQAVILLLDHRPEGSVGVILNRPTQWELNEVSSAIDECFGEQRLYFGGDVGAGTVLVIHGDGDVDGAREVTTGVYLGGYDSVVERVSDGSSKPQDYKFFSKCCGWGAGQLDREVEAGVWHPVSAARPLLLKQCLQLPKPLWREVMELCGGDLADEAKDAYAPRDAFDQQQSNDDDDDDDTYPQFP